MDRQYKSSILVWIFILSALYLISIYNYLLFHSLAEIFSICIAFTMFILSWTSRKYLNYNYLVLLGIAYLFVGLLDLFHTLSYKGMSIFTDYDYYANQIWIAARYLESLSIFFAVSVVIPSRKVRAGRVFILYSVITLFMLYSIFIWKIFPACFSDTTGLTLFKKISEYIISLILLSSLLVLRIKKSFFDEKILNYMKFAIAATIISELAFTFYINNYGLSNLVGHIFKIFSFYLIYRAIIQEGIEVPYNVIFKELTDKEKMITAQNRRLIYMNRRDGLTKLYNHSYMYELLNYEIERCKRYEKHLAVIMFDLDLFKEINDTYGHLKGDEILVQTAEIIKKSIRRTDFAGRYGGEEFLVILPETDSKTGFVVAEKIRIEVESFFSDKKLSVTMSGGISEYRQDIKINELINAADKNMYISKNSGRNVITVLS